MTWLDDENKIHEECIDCGKNAIEGNRCSDCWDKAGQPMKWSNKDKPITKIIDCEDSLK